MPTILDSLFHKVVNTTSTSIGVVGSHKVVDLPIQKIYMAKINGVNSCRLFSAPHITKCSYIDAQSHQPVCGGSLLAVYLARQVGAISRPPEHPCTPDRPVNEASVKVDH